VRQGEERGSRTVPPPDNQGIDGNNHYVSPALPMRGKGQYLLMHLDAVY